ncbi:MAG: hypothetical protein AB1512_19960 [Thermodesulfobacteriota bacterium]
MGQLVSLNLLILSPGRLAPGSEEELRRRWHEWASRRIRLRVSHLDMSPLGSGKAAGWMGVVSHMSRRMDLAGDAALLVDPCLRPNGNLLETLGTLLKRDECGWWFSVKTLPFYVHNVLVKEGNRVRNFEMEGVFSLDPERLMFFNHVTGRHFLHSQGAPSILASDRGLCFINPRRFDETTPLPYEFGEEDYVLELEGVERPWC